MKKLILIFMIALSVPTFGSTFIEIDTTCVAGCAFSSRHHNRIVVNNGRIKKVIFPEGDISVRIEEESGQAFVQALTNYVPVTTISVITDQGEVQDIELSFCDRSSEILVLTKTEEICCESSVTCCDEGMICHSPFESVILQVMNGDTPVGYVLGSHKKCRKKIKKGVEACLTKTLVSCTEEIYVWRISNCSKRFQEICENEVMIGNPDWVFLDKQELCPGGSALAITAVGKR